MRHAFILASVFLVLGCSDHTLPPSSTQAENAKEQKKPLSEKTAKKPEQFEDIKGAPSHSEASEKLGSAKDSSGISPIELEIYNLVNEHRTSRGLSPFAINAETFAQAGIHSENMAKSITSFGHQGFSERVKLISTSLGRPALMAGENVALVGSINAATNALRSWLGSAGHRANIEGDFTHTGLGVSQNKSGNLMFTQIFLKL